VFGNGDDVVGGLRIIDQCGELVLGLAQRYQSHVVSLAEDLAFVWSYIWQQSPRCVRLRSTSCATLAAVETIGIRELRQNASAWIAKAKAGLTIQITDRGRPVARLVPLTPAEQTRDKLIAEGQLIPATAPRVPLSTTDLIEGQSLTPILDEQRADR